MKRFPWCRPIAVLGALSLLALGAAVGCTPETSVNVHPAAGPAGISVSGEGSVFVSPDLARVTLGVAVTDETVAAARERAAEAMQAVLDALEANGIAEADIRTTAFNIHPEYRYSEDRGEEITGYQVRNLAIVTVRNLDDVPAVIDAATAAGGDAARVEQLEFTVEDREQHVGDARVQALENARAHAEQLATAAGVTLGAPISIVESGDSMPPPRPMIEESRAAGGDEAATPISPGEQRLRVAVQVVYAIE